MKKFLSDILIDPETFTDLAFDKEKKILFTQNNNSQFPVINDVPVILCEHQNITTTSLHSQLHTNFNYKDHYEKDAEVYDYFGNNEVNATKQEIKRLHEEIINKVPSGAQLLLDVGCGNGWLAHYFLKKNKQVISMDISTINPLKALQNDPHGNHAALVADAFNLPLKSDSIDCIIASEIMEHVHDPKVFVDTAFGQT